MALLDPRLIQEPQADAPIDPALISEPSGGLPLGQNAAPSRGLFGGTPAAIAPTERAGNPQLDAAMARALKLSSNPLYRFGSALAGQNPDAGLAPILQYQMFQQQRDQQVQEFLTNKRLAIGDQIRKGFEAMAAAPPAHQAIIGQYLREFVGPMLQEVGWQVTPAMEAAFGTQPGAATTYGALVTSRLGADRAKELEPMLAAIKDPKEALALIQSEFAAARDRAIPDAQKAIAEYSRTIFSDKARAARMGLVTPDGKTLPIPASAFVSGLLDDGNPMNSKDPVLKAAIAKVVTDPNLEGFLVQNRIQPGAIDLGAYKILVEGGAKTQVKVAEEEAMIPAAVKKAEALIPTEVQKAKALIPAEAQKAEAVTAATESVKAKFKGTEPLTVSDEHAIRTEFNRLSDDFLRVRDAYGRIQEVAKAPSAAGDLSLIFSYMKLLDPTSVVREGEQASAANARGVPDTVRTIYNRVLTGEKLADNQRADFLHQAGVMFRAQKKSHVQLESEFHKIVKSRGGDPVKILPDFIGAFRRDEGARAPTKPETAGALTRPNPNLAGQGTATGR